MAGEGGFGGEARQTKGAFSDSKRLLHIKHPGANENAMNTELWILLNKQRPSLDCASQKKLDQLAGAAHQGWRTGKGLVITLCVALWLMWPAVTEATQDDVLLPLLTPEAVLAAWGEDKRGVSAVDQARGDTTVGIYVASPDDQRWYGRVGSDFSLLRGALWGVRMGLSAETVMDTGNGIDFRLIRLYYEVPIQVDVRLGPGVLSGGFRHRCSHGVDGAVADRILIRSGVDLSYLTRFDLGPVWLSALGEAHLTMIGQNTDRDFQPRGMFTVAAQLEWPFVEGLLALIGGAGLGVAWIGQGGEIDPEGVYGIGDEPAFSMVEWLPAATLGVRFWGQGASVDLLIHYQRILDSGLTEQARPSSLTSVRLGFGW